MISVHHAGNADASRVLSVFRQEFYRCLTSRADALFELADAVLCADSPVRSVAELSLAGEHRRGHGSGYAALTRGRVEVNRLRTALTAVSLPRAPRTDGWCWRSMSPAGCAQRHTPARSGSCVTPTAAARIST